MRSTIHGLLASALIGCSSAQLTPPTTGLTGTVTRGPVTPVCRVDVPCSAPITGNFAVMQGMKTVATFRSNAEGQFTVMLYPGEYAVKQVDGPSVSPFNQPKTVTVAKSGLTTVHLEFDTGIR